MGGQSTAKQPEYDRIREGSARVLDLDSLSRHLDKTGVMGLLLFLEKSKLVFSLLLMKLAKLT